MTSIPGKEMRIVAGMAVSILCTAMFDMPAARAQVGEATRALDEAVGQAQRLLRGSYAWRRHGRRAQQRRKDVAPLRAAIPSRNPNRIAKDQPGDAKKAAANADVPAPDVWTDSEVFAAARDCKKVLKNVKAKFVQAKPVKKGPCGNPAPYRLASLGGPGQSVVFTPPATLNCRMIAALDRWFRRDLQRLARKHLGSPITRVSVMSSYSCRNAYGRTSTRLSEHAKANALDIGGFRTADGNSTELLAHWGLTKRDLEAKAKKLAEEQRERQFGTDGQATKVDEPTVTPTSPNKRAKAGTREKAAPQPATGDSISGREQGPSAAQLPALPERRPSLRQRLLWAKAKRNRNVAEQTRKSREAYRRGLKRFLSPRNNLGGPKPTQKAGSDPGEGKATAKIDRAAFLRAAHSSACRIFGTVLGPEANDAHRNHFHVDLAYRRRSNYCR